MLRLYKVFLITTMVAFFSFSGIDLAICNELKIIDEVKFKTIFDVKTKKKFEASGVVFVDNNFYVVFDNHSQITRINYHLNNIKLLGHNNTKIGYEGITYNDMDNEFYLIEESINNQGLWNARLGVTDNKFSSEPERSWLRYNFQNDNKGFEGVAFLRNENKTYILALCEGNACKAGSKSKKYGAGTIKVFEKKTKGWEYITSISLPKNLTFIDYSGIDINTQNELAISSQETSAIWISELNITKWHITDNGKVYYFPKNKKGKKIYCNVEGISWITKNKLVVVSDAMKSNQSKRCKKKEQAIHLISLNNM